MYSSYPTPAFLCARRELNFELVKLKSSQLFLDCMVDGGSDKRNLKCI